MQHRVTGINRKHGKKWHKELITTNRLYKEESNDKTAIRASEALTLKKNEQS